MVTSNSDTPKKNTPRGLNNIFSNVKRTKKLSQKQKKNWDRSATLKCENCGAPQEATDNFRCRYCGGQLVKSPEPTAEE
jgi:DNA-directed RNA polymerase subunit RPC12/RpoP